VSNAPEIVEIACRTCGTMRTWQRTDRGALLVRSVLEVDPPECPGGCQPRELASPMASAYAHHLRETRGHRRKQK